ncbi:MAG: hypothetical protein AAF594_16225 [Bacteroidota bacterium]
MNERRPPQSKPHRSVPDGCDAETTSRLDTAAGPLTLRVRRYTWIARVHVTDRLSLVHGTSVDLRPVSRYEVAVLTAKLRRLGAGYKVLTDNWHAGDYREPEDLLTVMLGASEEVLAALDAYVRRHPEKAADRAPVRAERDVRPEMPEAGTEATVSPLPVAA